MLLNVHGIILLNRYVHISVMIENGNTSLFFAIMSSVIRSDSPARRKDICVLEPMHLECMHSVKTSLDGPSSAIFLV